MKKREMREAILKLQAELLVVRADLDWAMRLAAAETPEAREALVNERENIQRMRLELVRRLEQAVLSGVEDAGAGDGPKFTGFTSFEEHVGQLKEMLGPLDPGGMEKLDEFLEGCREAMDRWAQRDNPGLSGHDAAQARGEAGITPSTQQGRSPEAQEN